VFNFSREQPRMKITITGLPGSGTSTVGRELADRLGYEFQSGGNIFRQMAAENGMSLYEFDHFVRSHPEHDHWLDNRQAEYGREHDNFVLESRLGWYFVPDSLKVRLDCELDERMRRVADREGISIEEAREKNSAREKTYIRYRELYGIEDFLSDEHFHVTADTTNRPAADVVDELMSRMAESQK